MSEMKRNLVFPDVELASGRRSTGDKMIPKNAETVGTLKIVADVIAPRLVAPAALASRRCDESTLSCPAGN